MATIRFGSNTFSTDKEFTVIGVGDMDNLIMGGFGPRPQKPLVWITFRGDAAFLNAELVDADNEVVLQIKDNVITVNKNNIYRLEQRPDNQIPPDRVIVINKYGETALDLQRVAGIWDFNGDFYYGKWHIVATPKGTTINPSTPQV